MSERPSGAGVLQGFVGTALCVGDGITPPVPKGAVVVDRTGRIVAVGPQAAVQARFPDVPFAAFAAVLTPGLVNAHTHLELSALRGRVPGGGGFVAWLRILLQRRAAASPEENLEAISSGAAELLRCGTAAVGEVTNTLATVEALSSAPLLACVFHEVYGVTAERAGRVLALARQARAALGTLPANLRYALSPHTPYSTHPELLREVLAEPRPAGTRLSMHVLEHSAERAFMTGGGGPLARFLEEAGLEPDWASPAVGSVAHLEQLSALGPEMIVVHLTDAHEEEIVRVAALGCPVVLCPRSNLHIEVRLPPLTALLAAGVRPGLGTDSLASSPSLDVLAEAQALHLRFPQVPARTLLAMATGFGADVLGLSDHVGRLTEGLSPGVVAFPHGPQPPVDPERFVVAGRFAGERQVLCRPAVPPAQS